MAMNSEAVLAHLMEGNRRFSEGVPVCNPYELDRLREMAISQHPHAAIIYLCRQ